MLRCRRAHRRVAQAAVLAAPAALLPCSLYLGRCRRCLLLRCDCRIRRSHVSRHAVPDPPLLRRHNRQRPLHSRSLCTLVLRCACRPSCCSRSGRCRTSSPAVHPARAVAATRPTRAPPPPSSPSSLRGSPSPPPAMRARWCGASPSPSRCASLTPPAAHSARTARPGLPHRPAAPAPPPPPSTSPPQSPPPHARLRQAPCDHRDHRRRVLTVDLLARCHPLDDMRRAAHGVGAPAVLLDASTVRSTSYIFSAGALSPLLG